MTEFEESVRRILDKCHHIDVTEDVEHDSQHVECLKCGAWIKRTGKTYLTNIGTNNNCGGGLIE